QHLGARWKVLAEHCRTRLGGSEDLGIRRRNAQLRQMSGDFTRLSGRIVSHENKAQALRLRNFERGRRSRNRMGTLVRDSVEVDESHVIRGGKGSVRSDECHGWSSTVG